jgi:4-hydroxy-2-oxoheptanedioate aldolase
LDSDDVTMPAEKIESIPARGWRLDRTTATLRDAWAAGKATYGGWVGVGHPYSGELLGRAGFDWVGIDLQHGAVSEHETPQIIQAIAATGTPALVRVGWPEPRVIMKVLDAGANGVIVPMINTPEEAQEAVRACRYPPAGIRSWGPNRAALGVPEYAARDGWSYTLCVVMIETVEAARRVGELLAVPGIDAVFVGPGDLALTHGYEQSFSDERLVAKLKEISKQCAEAGVVSGIYAGTASEAARWAREGYQFIALLSDSDFIVAGAGAILTELAEERQGGSDRQT